MCIKVLVSILLGVAIATQSPLAQAQSYPARPVRIIVPLAPGGLADILARVVAQRLGEVSGRRFVVENRPGGGGAIGAADAAKSPPDGYTLFLGSQGLIATLPHLVRLNFDPARDFVPIIHLGTFLNVLVVNPALPVRTARELVEHAKANPGKVSYASQGNGTSGHMVAEQFKLLTGTDMVHVPYRGAAPAVRDLVAGHVQVMFDSITLQMPQLTAGTTRALAVMSPKRIGVLPAVPTMAESGFAEMQGGTWFGLFAPIGTPRRVVDWLNGEARKAFAPPQVRQRFLSQGAVLPLGTPDAFAAHVAAEHAKWGEVVRRANIRLD